MYHLDYDNHKHKNLNKHIVKCKLSKLIWFETKHVTSADMFIENKQKQENINER